MSLRYIEHISHLFYEFLLLTLNKQMLPKFSLVANFDYNQQINLMSLTHFMPLVFFYTLWKH